MKKSSIILLAIASLSSLLIGCASSESAAASDPREISWRAFCQARGYDSADTSAAAVNEYLDAWRGSACEEAALIKAGIEPF